jgi:hypothetical protein
MFEIIKRANLTPRSKDLTYGGRNEQAQLLGFHEMRQRA